MNYSNLNWSIRILVQKRSRIDPQPQWQRGEAWKEGNKQLLLDSILAGFDIPKIYLWKLDENASFEYAIADGQQRLRAIWSYVDDEYALSTTSGRPWSGLKYNQLTDEFLDRINMFKVVVTVVTASDEEIRELFARLQKGVRLTPPQIRNSMPSALGTIVRSMAVTHPFFLASSFSLEGFVRDDYLAHVFALEINGKSCELKAPELSKMYIDQKYFDDQLIIKKINRVLLFLKQMQTAIPNLILTKWGFVDLYWVVSNHLEPALSADILARRYYDFEKLRKRYVGDPRPLLNKSSGVFDEDLYQYISAFKVSAGTDKNVAIRYRVLSSKLLT